MKDLSTAVAGQHVRELRTEACLSRLSALVDRCRHSALRRGGDAVVRWLRNGQLGPAYCSTC